jgi:hypothetical protein
VAFLGVVLVFGLLGLPGCVTVDEQGDMTLPDLEDSEQGKILKKQISKRIYGLKFQRGVALLDSLNWLILYGDHAVPQLLEALNDPDPRTRSYSAYVLGEIGNDSVVKDLRATLEGEDHKLVRYEIAASLVTLGDWGQLGVLISGLNEQSKLFRYKCFEILRKNLNLTFGYDPESPAEERALAVQKWVVWWERNRESFTPVLQ